MNEQEPFDQQLFEPDPFEEEREPTLLARIKKALLVLIALTVVLGLVYLSGVYQTFLFERTSPLVEQERVDEKLDTEVLDLPLRIFIAREGETFGSARSLEDVERLIENAGEIWKQASINVVIESVREVSLRDEDTGLFLSDPARFIQMLPNYDNTYITVFLTRTLSGINGVAFSGARAVAVADFTTVFDFRTLAHEIGHILSLEHVPGDKGRLMFRGANGFELTLPEVLKARERLLGL